MILPALLVGALLKPAFAQSAPMGDAADTAILMESPSPAAQTSSLQAKPAPVAAAAAAKDSADAQWQVLKGAESQTEPAVLSAAAKDLESFAGQHSGDARAPLALNLAGQINEKARNDSAAMIDFLRLVYEYPDSDKAFQAKSSFLDLSYGQFSRKDRPALDALAGGAPTAEKTSREAALLDGLSGPLAQEWAPEAAAYLFSFKERFPNYSQGDRIQEDLARIYQNSGQSEAALWEYQGLLEAYPASSHLPETMMAVADLYAGPLHDYQKAVDTYQDFVSRYPQNADVLNALRKTAALLTDKLRQYPLAIQIDQRIAALYPHTLSAMTALKTAADLAHDRIEDYKLEISLRTEIATEFSQSAEAAYQLYYAGLAYEKHLMNEEQALALDQQALGHNPGFWLSFRIKWHVRKLEKQLAKAQAPEQLPSSAPSASPAAPSAASASAPPADVPMTPLPATTH